MSDVGEHSPESVLSNGHARWDLAERFAELQAELAERVEKERVRELEIISLRNELNLHLAYTQQVETTLAEQREYAETALAEQRQRSETALAELAELRRSFQVFLAEQHRFTSGYRSHIESLTVELHEEAVRRQMAEQALLAERSRVSYRIVERLLRRLPSTARR